MIRLPVITAGGAHAARFNDIRSREIEIAREISLMSLAEIGQYEILSPNAKTSVSLDFPIGHTCNPTALCGEVCYASRPGTPAAWDKSLRKRLRNLAYFKRTPTAVATARLIKEFRRERETWRRRSVELDFLRINGTGDLFTELVPVLNEFANRMQDVTLWIVTRRPELAAAIVRRSNVYLQISTDSSTRHRDLEAIDELVAGNPRAYTSFLRTKPEDNHRGAGIVFNEKRTAGLPYDGPRVCPVDAGRLELGNVKGQGGDACAKCRKCFSASTLDRQKRWSEAA